MWRVHKMAEKKEKLFLPEKVYSRTLKFFQKTSLPRIQKERTEAKTNAPSGNKKPGC
jgi:hypothetical protein